jgi:hypothetical protein
MKNHSPQNVIVSSTLFNHLPHGVDQRDGIQHPSAVLEGPIGPTASGREKCAASQ